MGNIRKGQELVDYGAVVFAKYLDNQEKVPPRVILNLDIALSHVDLAIREREIADMQKGEGKL
ncbi:MAG: hypothetical protein WC294_00320 [Methanoregula sp.]|jgi:hypothetical protein